MEFNPDFFKTEIRSGFEVEPMVKRAWANELELLALLDKICRKNNIKYYAAWGTLLGAVRHNGFIPWDDDLDITMKRSDFMKFVKIANKKLPKGISLKCIYTRKAFYTCTAYLSYDNMSLDSNILKARHGFPFVAGIDIMPLDELPTDNAECETLYNLFTIIQGARAAVKSDIPEKERYLNAVEEFTLCKVDRDGDILHHLTEIFDKFNQLYIRSGGKLVNTEFWPEHYNRVFPPDCFSGTVDMPFENLMISAPSGYHEILTILYGDYMTPVYGGSSHEYPYYKKQADKLNQHLIDNGHEPIDDWETNVQMRILLNDAENKLNQIRLQYDEKI